MKRISVVLFLLCFLVLGFSVHSIAGEIEKTVIEEDTVISEDTTWTGDVVINEEVTLMVKDCALTIKEGNITNRGSLIVERADLIRESKSRFKTIANRDILEFKNATTNFRIYLHEDSIFLAEDSKLEDGGIFFHGEGINASITNCEINRLKCECDATLKISGRSKINILDVTIRIFPDADTTYINGQFTKDSHGYFLPEVGVSSETEISSFGYAFLVQQRARVTIQDSVLFYLDLYQDSEVILNNCEFLSPFGYMDNRGGVVMATNCTFRNVRTYEENASTTLTDCTVNNLVESTKGTLRLINTKVGDKLYKDRTLKEGERLSQV